jgi:hypothetical protein
MSDYPDTTSTDPETTIRRALWRYPTMFGNRADVLYFLFCVIGNGYEWIGGELIAVDHGEPWDDRQNEPRFTSELMREIEEQARARRFALIDRNRSDIEKWATDPGPMNLFVLGSGGPGWQIRPEDLSGYQHLWSVPDDITDDWRRVWQEARDQFIPLYEALPADLTRAAAKSWESSRRYTAAGPFPLPVPAEDPNYPDAMLPLTRAAEDAGFTRPPNSTRKGLFIREIPTGQIRMRIHTPDNDNSLMIIVRVWAPHTNPPTHPLGNLRLDGLPDHTRMSLARDFITTMARHPITTEGTDQ